MSLAPMFGGAVETVGRFVVERYEHKGRPAVYIRQMTPKARFSGWKSYKHILCRKPEDVDRIVGDLRASLEAHEARKVARRAERSAFDARTVLKPGDVVYNSWGYEQTNIDWYRVVGVSKAFCVLQAVCSSIVEETGHMSGKSKPAEGCPESCAREHATSRHGVGAFQGRASINFRHGAGVPWDGRAMYCSWYA